MRTRDIAVPLVFTFCFISMLVTLRLHSSQPPIKSAPTVQIVTPVTQSTPKSPFFPPRKPKAIRLARRSLPDSFSTTAKKYVEIINGGNTVCRISSIFLADSDYAIELELTVPDDSNKYTNLTAEKSSVSYFYIYVKKNRLHALLGDCKIKQEVHIAFRKRWKKPTSPADYLLFIPS